MTRQRILVLAEIEDAPIQKLQEVVRDMLCEEDGDPNRVAAGAEAYDAITWDLHRECRVFAHHSAFYGPNGLIEIVFDRLLHPRDIHIYEVKDGRDG